MNKESRRRFLAASGKLFVGASALGSVAAYAAAEHHDHGAGDGQVFDASKQEVCATCKFWGGMRKLSDDKTRVKVQSMGWCNNPESPNYQRLTAAGHQMKKPGIWTRWDVL